MRGRRDGVDARGAGRIGKVEVSVLRLGEGQSAAARAEHDAEAASLFRGEVGGLEARVVYGLARRGERERDGARDVAAVFRLQLGLPVEAGHLPCDADGRAADVEALDAADAALAAQQAAPERLAPDAERRHAPEPRDDDAARLP